MSNRGEFKPISVVTRSHKFLLDRTSKLSNNTKDELEALAFYVIASRYPSEKYVQLQEFLQKVSNLPLEKGEPKSKAHQLVIIHPLMVQY